MAHNLDILAVGVHPDDVELSCAGTLLRHLAAGYTCGILDLTLGELGTRGSAELRLKESEAAAKILGLTLRDHCNLADGFFRNDEAATREIIVKIRKYRPRIVLANAISDRHPDHGRAAQLVKEACFYAGLSKIETHDNGQAQQAWRPAAVYHYTQDYYIKPDFTIDVTPYVDKKMESIAAYASQFFNPGSAEPVTPISNPEFFEQVKSKMMVAGREIGAVYGEGFTVNRSPGVADLFHLL